MNKHYVNNWETRKSLLEEWFRLNKVPHTYKTIVEKLFELVLIPEHDYSEKFNVAEITLIDNGDYQGTQLFFIPYSTYQPRADEYAFTSCYYGSCSGCDTLEGILSDGYDAYPTEGQLKDLMTLALHLVQNTRNLMDSER